MCSIQKVSKCDSSSDNELPKVKQYRGMELDCAPRNLVKLENGFTMPWHRFMHEEWLCVLQRRHCLIFSEPPTFSHTNILNPGI